jgi:glycine betaine/proline transport system permease protein
LLSALPTSAEAPKPTDNEVLDEYTIPFGEWIDQAVDWIAVNMTTLLEIIEWPFKTLLDLVVNDFLLQVSWVLVVAMMFMIAWLVRNLKVAFGVAAALTLCGLLGDAYWIETARTIGYIAVAVGLCVVIGLPLGILCGRLDGAWLVTRPTLDAMQVVHAFVYMLPFIFFWGIGPVAATMATMVFALPPLIRLTNLGVRQVPEEVVEASRAYGAPEWRVLLDVQIPLARPAIMTGVNQTLLMSISMLGIAAIMGAGGLGRLLFRALSNQEVALAASGGLAFFLVAVSLDRMSQPEGTDKSLLSRIGEAWRHRTDPEVLLEGEDTFDAAEIEREILAGEAIPTSRRERRYALIAAAGSVVALVGLFLPWSIDAGKISGWSRRADESLPGQEFNGLAASGGSWFGIMVGVGAVAVLAGVVVALVRNGYGPRWLAPDGAVIASSMMLITSLAFFLSSPSALLDDDFRMGAGVLVTIVGSAGALVGSVLWMTRAPYAPKRPLPLRIRYGKLAGGVAAILMAVVTLFASWSFDERQDVVFSDELLEEIAAIEQAVAGGEVDGAVGATQIASLTASATRADVVILDGKTSDGAQLGIWTLVFTLIGSAFLLPAAGAFGFDDRRQWAASTLVVGFGFGVLGLSVGWIGTLVRATDPNFVSGFGSFLAMLVGCVLVATSWKLVDRYERLRSYDDDQDLADLATAQGALQEPISDPADNVGVVATGRTV